MHQLPFLDALVDRSADEVVCAYAEPITADRLDLGWGGTDASRVSLVSPGPVEAERMIREAGPETLNVVSGMHCHPAVVRWFHKAVAARSPIALISESYDPRGAKGVVRRVRSTFDAMRYRNRISLIFAMGSLGERWFRRAGFRGDSIRPFTYVTAAGSGGEPPGRSTGVVRLAFVGQLIPRKGVDVLIRAVAMLKSLPWSLSIVGGGESESMLRGLAESEGVADRIDWLGAVPNSTIPELLATHDALILPSRHDGWGAVVNEALTAGTPALCSAACGAADLISSTTCGEVFPAGNVAALAAAIRRRVTVGPVTAVDRAALGRHAERFSPGVIAEYFEAVVEAAFSGARTPPPPWRISA
jgi:glycosyltransferase involved in cell wall biosynthesis